MLTDDMLWYGQQSAERDGEMPITKIDCFNFDLSVRDLKINDQYLIATLGEGSYIVDAKLAFNDYAKTHILIGRYSSLAHDLIFNIGINHNYHYASSYPFDDIDIWQDYCTFERGNCNYHQIIIGHDVWIGAGVTIMSGVRIGNGAVVGANATVAKDIPPYAIVVGNPARVIKYRFAEDVIAKLQAIKWWDWPVERIREALPLMENMEEFIARYYIPPKIPATTKLSVEVAELHKVHQFYHLCPDIDSDGQVWRPFVQKYIHKFAGNASVILLLWLPKGRLSSAVACETEIRKMLEREVKRAPQIMTYRGGKEAMRTIIKDMDVIVTTKEIETFAILDSLCSTKTKVIYACDF